jgi:hypothetical protein
MRRTKTGLSPSLDVMEPRVLLSRAAPLLSQHALNGVVRDVRSIMSTLARTEDTLRASASLTALSSRVPSGPDELAPSWQSDIGLYRPGSARSIVTTERRILDDLYFYLQDGADGGGPPVTGPGFTTSTTPGPGAGGTTTPLPAPGLPGPGMGSTTTPEPATCLDSVSIQNTTGLALRVTVYLETSHTPQPFITETIPAQQGSIALFNFGTATDAFMTMDVSLADGGQTPPPFTDISLSQPISGYNGTLFTISLFGSYFNVSPL